MLLWYRLQLVVWYLGSSFTHSKQKKKITRSLTLRRKELGIWEVLVVRSKYFTFLRQLHVPCSYEANLWPMSLLIRAHTNFFYFCPPEHKPDRTTIHGCLCRHVVIAENSATGMCFQFCFHCQHVFAFYFVKSDDRRGMQWWGFYLHRFG